MKGRRTSKAKNISGFELLHAICSATATGKPMVANQNLPIQYWAPGITQKLRPVGHNLLACLLLLGSTLISASAKAMEPIRLNQTLAPFGNVDQFFVSEDSQRVVFGADVNGDNLRRFYSVGVRGGSVTSLTPQRDPLEELNLAQLLGDRLFFLHNDGGGASLDLYSVPVKGGTTVKYNTQDLTSAFATRFKRSPNGNRVVYYARQHTSTRFELFSVPVGGGTNTRLHEPIFSNRTVTGEFAFTPDGSRVIFIADLDGDSNFSADDLHLFSAPAEGGEPVEISPNVPDGHDVIDFNFVPGSQTVVFRAEDPSGATTFYRVPALGGVATPLGSGALPGTAHISQWRVAGNHHVVYRADAVTDGAFELFSLPLAGGAPFRISQLLAEVEDDFQLTPNSNRVVFRAVPFLASIARMYSVAVSGGNVATLSPENTQPTDSIVFNALLSDNGQRVFFIRLNTDPNTTDRELYSNAITGGDLQLLVPRQPSASFSGGVSTLSTSLNNRLAAYSFFENVGVSGFQTGFFLVSADGSEQRAVGGEFPFSASCCAATFTPDGKTLIYSGEQNLAGQNELFSLRVAEEEELCVPIVSANNNIALVCL